MAHLIVRPPPLSSSHPRTTPPSRWPAFTTLPPLPSFSSFGAACVKLCCLPITSLVRNTLLCCVVFVYLKMKINSSIVFCAHSGCAHGDIRCLRATIVERPIEYHKSLASSETGDGLTGPLGGGSLDRTKSVKAWTGPNRCRNGRESSVRVQAQRKSLDRTKPCAREALSIHSVQKC